MKIHVRFLRDSEFESLLEIAEWATPPYFFPRVKNGEICMR